MLSETIAGFPDHDFPQIYQHFEFLAGGKFLLSQFWNGFSWVVIHPWMVSGWMACANTEAIVVQCGQ